MNWAIAIVTGVVLAVFFVLKRFSLVSVGAARKLLAGGALVIDVRSPEEFRCGHLPDAVNIPLSELRENLPRHVKDKNQTLLLHCLSGGRSAMAQRHVKSLGYLNVFNLGSYCRAKQILEGRRNV